MKGDGCEMKEDGMLPAVELELELGSAAGASLLGSAEQELVREIVEQVVEGRFDHRTLTGRECENQHPVSAVEGLQGELDRIPAPTEALNNFELEELLK